LLHNSKPLNDNVGLYSDALKKIITILRNIEDCSETFILQDKFAKQVRQASYVGQLR
jgi:hypothetical protein